MLDPSIKSTTEPDVVYIDMCPERPQQQRRQKLKPLAIRLADACEALSLSGDVLLEAARVGRVRLTRIGNQWLMPVRELERLLRAC
jgi:hypothetical protein